MQTPQAWIWQQSDWPHFRWDPGALTMVLPCARLAQGKVLGVTQLLDAKLSLEAVATILTENGVTTSAIEGERLDVDAVRSSVARHLWVCHSPVCLPRHAMSMAWSRFCWMPSAITIRR